MSIKKLNGLLDLKNTDRLERIQFWTNRIKAIDLA